MKHRQDKFLDVIWMDEYRVQIQRHSLHVWCYRKKGQPKRFKPYPKHQLKIHTCIWAGILCHGASSFTGTLVAMKLTEIFEASLIPFIRKVYLVKRQLMKNNVPKHARKVATEYLENNGIVWWKPHDIILWHLCTQEVDLRTTYLCLLSYICSIPYIVHACIYLHIYMYIYMLTSSILIENDNS